MLFDEGDLLWEVDGGLGGTMTSLMKESKV